VAACRTLLQLAHVSLTEDMIRSLLRNVGRLAAAVLLLGIAVCATETALRVQRILYPETAGTFQQPRWYQPSPTTYLEPVPGLQLTRQTALQPLVEIRTSEWGTRGESPTLPKPQQTVRILCLGSKGLFAAELPEAQTSCYLLQDRLQSVVHRPVEVINGGCPEAGPLVQLLRLRHSLLSLQPDLVLLLIHPDDLPSDLPVRTALRFDRQGQPAWSRHPQLRAKPHLLQHARSELLILDRLLGEASQRLVSSAGPDAPRELTDQDLSQLSQTLQQMHALCRGHFAQLLIVLQPDPWQLAVNPASSSSPSGDPLRQKLIPELATQGLQCWDLLPVFQQSANKRELFTSTGELSPQGQQLIATTLAGGLIKDIPLLQTGGRSDQPAARESTPIRWNP
jgi:hypothetical protein